MSVVIPLSRPKRELARADPLPIEQYQQMRRESRAKIADIKKHRRIEVGPFITFYFECYETMWHQVHEMLYIERGGEQQIEDELRAYNPLIPKGRELVATVMLEIEDPVRRRRMLEGLGHIEHTMRLRVASAVIPGIPEADTERTKEDGKTSSVHFLHFPFTPEQSAAFRQPGARVEVAIEHQNYGHIAVMPETVRVALARDLEE
jgi:hypothetical protein